MLTPFITSDPSRFPRALERIAARERQARRRRLSRPGWFTRLFRPAKARALTPHVCRISDGEIITSNL